MVTPVGFEVRPSASPAEFEAWLEAEHERAPGVHVEVARKAAGVPSITAAEAVEVALRFGWIDGRGNRVDDDRSTVRCTPRRAESVWSQEDVETVARLVAEGRMRPAGSATITVPDDLTAALAARTGSQPPCTAHRRLTAPAAGSFLSR